MFAGISNKIVLLAKKGGAADVTPDALSYVTPKFTQTANNVELYFGTFTGINVPINILIYGDGDYDEFSYSINNGTAIEIYGYPPSTSITINNGDSLTTYWTFLGSGPNTFVVTLYNQSDNNALLAEAVYQFIQDV